MPLFFQFVFFNLNVKCSVQMHKVFALWLGQGTKPTGLVKLGSKQNINSDCQTFAYVTFHPTLFTLSHLGSASSVQVVWYWRLTPNVRVVWQQNKNRVGVILPLWLDNSTQCKWRAVALRKHKLFPTLLLFKAMCDAVLHQCVLLITWRTRSIKTSIVIRITLRVTDLILEFS